MNDSRQTDIDTERSEKFDPWLHLGGCRLYPGRGYARGERFYITQEISDRMRTWPGNNGETLPEGTIVVLHSVPITSTIGRSKSVYISPLQEIECTFILSSGQMYQGFLTKLFLDSLPPDRRQWGGSPVDLIDKERAQVLHEALEGHCLDKSVLRATDTAATTLGKFHSLLVLRQEVQRVLAEVSKN